MFRSIRWTLQLWHAAILVLALVLMGGALDMGLSSAYFARVDAQLESAARFLVTAPLAFGPLSEGRPGGPFFSPRGNGSADAPGGGVLPDQKIPTPSPGGIFPDRPPGFSEADLWNTVPLNVLHRPGESERDQPYFVVWSPEGTVLRTTAPDPGVQSEAPARFVPSASGPDLAPRFRQRGEYREVMLAGPFGITLLVGKSMETERATLTHFRLVLLGAGVTVLAIGLCGGWMLSKRAIRPIEQISATARAISASDLSRRIVLDETHSELGSLALTLNETFSRLETAFERQIRFTADASHELRTPLSVIQTHSELALTKERSAGEYRQTIETTLRATRRMKSLVESLLVLARSDARQFRLEFERFDLRQVTEECVAQAEGRAREMNVTIETSLVPLLIESDRTHVSQLLTNLLANAIQYNRSGGRIQCTIGTDDAQAVIRIVDNGVGIAPEDQPRIFERFFRADKARSREGGGVGLGLAICQGIVTALGGSISFTSQLGVGTTFVVRLPVHASPAPV